MLHFMHTSWHNNHEWILNKTYSVKREVMHSNRVKHALPQGGIRILVCGQ